MKICLENHPFIRRLAVLALLVALMLSSPGCTLSQIKLPGGTQAPTTAPTIPPILSPTPTPVAEVSFSVFLPAPLAEGETLVISILDEVTGLALNAANYPLQAVDTQTYTISLPLPLNAVVKYRYALIGSFTAQEIASADTLVRYRLYHVTGPGVVQDWISGWTGQPYSGTTGSIQGLVLTAESGTPIPNILVTAGGMQTLTDASGRFYLEGLSPGVHNLVVYALDGTYQTFQQGALIAGDLITPVQVGLIPAPMVNVTFNVSVPENTVRGAPIRLAGNLQQLGNSFGDLTGGMSVVADRMPVMTALADGRYSLTMHLPVGAYVRYKYTLGDGFWNAEHKENGEYRLRAIVIPSGDVTINDTVETWQAGSSAPILFDVTIPSNTPAGDIVYIQFNPFGWTEPIPMWPVGNNRWAYKLYGPLNILGSFGYRYCRNAQCGSADDIATAGSATSGRSVTTSQAPETIQDSVDGWVWLQDTGPSTLVGTTIQARTGDFMAGVEFQPTYQPNWSIYTPQALQNVQALGSNWVILTPTWTYAHTSPLVFSPQPGKDPLWNDTALMINHARALNLNVALFPSPHFPISAADWWQAAPRDAGWWQDWFDLYRQYILNYATLASISDAQAIILGGDWLSPALPGGLLVDGGESSGVPADAENRWRALVGDVRARFKRQVLWALPYSPGSLQDAPAFLDEVDGIYLLWYTPLSTQVEPAKEDLEAEAGRLLDEEIEPFQSAQQKPVILALAFPSVTGAASGCLSDGAGGCLEWMALSRPNPDVDFVTLNLQAQSDLYESMLVAINARAWVGGYVSRGYYPPVILQDKSASVHGKPTGDVLWYWFPRLLGIIK